MQPSTLARNQNNMKKEVILSYSSPNQSSVFGLFLLHVRLSFPAVTYLV